MELIGKMRGNANGAEAPGTTPIVDHITYKNTSILERQACYLTRSVYANLRMEYHSVIAPVIFCLGNDP